ncbi:MAG: sigma-54-dependent Fis family transcriptional regulator [Deltaproteobacteria bacterium]|nr:sigma-54-dependent Fis family transcriptional regulator [Deltaproteobacteria bacterium]
MSWQGKTTLEPERAGRKAPEAKTEALALAVVWAKNEPGRLGEVLFPTERCFFGRGPVEDDEDPRVGLLRQRPKKNAAASDIEDPFVSRKALELSASDDAIEIKAVGKRKLRFNETEALSATVHEGDYVELEGLFGFYCVRRLHTLPDGGVDLEPKAFGHADAYGIVGESAAVWALRTQVGFFGKRNAHVLVTGASGTGKELVAQAIHRLSTRAKKEIVARNAATFPSGLIDAELFGNLANYPNSGMPERPGLIGQADGSTLFLDEIGELPSELQAHLLRVLDGGEYQRLGESKRRVADIRLIAATNRSVEELKEDLGARLGLRLHLPGLDERREDVTLIARHLLARTAAKDPQIGERFFEGWDGKTGEPRLSADLARALVLHGWTTHVRELDGLLWKAASGSRGGELELTEEVRKLVKIAPPKEPVEVTAEEIRAALTRHGGVKDKAWRELRLPSRHALHRLMKKLNIPD